MLKNIFIRFPKTIALDFYAAFAISQQYLWLLKPDLVYLCRYTL